MQTLVQQSVDFSKETDISSIIPRRRNEVICAALELCKFIEKKGSGFDKIEEDYRDADAYHKPYISYYMKITI